MNNANSSISLKIRHTLKLYMFQDHITFKNRFKKLFRIIIICENMKHEYLNYVLK